MKPRITMYRSRIDRQIKWTCSGGEFLFDGWGVTPAEAYQSWLDQEIPF